MNPLYSVPWTAPVEPAPHGLLASPDLVWWVFGAIVAVLAMLSMPTGLKTAAGELWRPIKGWIASVHALSAVLTALVGFTCCMGLVAIFCGMAMPPEDEDEPDEGDYEPFPGFIPPILT